MLNDVDIQSDDPAELRRLNALLAAEVKSQALVIERLQHQLAGQNRHRFGSKSESLDQLNLVLQEDQAIAESAEEQVAPAPPPEAGKPARRHSRKPLPCIPPRDRAGPLSSLWERQKKGPGLGCRAARLPV